MSIITGLTAERMQEIIDQQILSGAVDLSGKLVFTRADGSTLDAGQVKGAKGDSFQYPVGSFANNSVPNYVRLGVIDGINTSNGAHWQFYLTGVGGIGTMRRATVLVHVTQRGSNLLDVRTWGWGLENTPANSIRLFSRQTGEFMFEIWAQFGTFTLSATLDELSNFRTLVTMDSKSPTAPTSPALYEWSVRGVASATDLQEGSDNEISVTPKGLRDSGVGNPPGAVMMTASITIPSGWLVCQGQAISRTDYARLFAAIGTDYGAGNGSTTFNIPNLKGRVAVGADPADVDMNILGETGGAKTQALTIAQMPAHTHTPGANTDGFIGHLTTIDGSQQARWNTFASGQGGEVGSYRQPVSQGSGQAHNNMQPFIALHYIIKF